MGIYMYCYVYVIPGMVLVVASFPTTLKIHSLASFVPKLGKKLGQWLGHCPKIPANNKLWRLMTSLCLL